MIPFQSTLPVGGATPHILDDGQIVLISIHAPRGGSDIPVPDKAEPAEISIHAPRGGSDPELR